MTATTSRPVMCMRQGFGDPALDALLSVSTGGVSVLTESSATQRTRLALRAAEHWGGAVLVLAFGSDLPVRAMELRSWVRSSGGHAQARVVDGWAQAISTVAEFFHLINPPTMNGAWPLTPVLVVLADIEHARHERLDDLSDVPGPVEWAREIARGWPYTAVLATCTELSDRQARGADAVVALADPPRLLVPAHEADGSGR